MSRRIGFCPSLVSHHHHRLRLPFFPLPSTWNRGCDPLPSSEGCGPVFLCWMGVTYQGGTREVGGPARCITGRVRDIIASSFSSFFLFFIFFALTTLPQPPTGSTRIPPAAAVYPPSFANARRRNFPSRRVLLFVDKGAYTRRVSPSARLFNKLCRLFIPLPRLQVRVG